jgi:hypothetical protein
MNCHITYQPDFEPGRPWLLVGPPTGEWSVVPGALATVPQVAYQRAYATFEASLEAAPGAELTSEAAAQLDYELASGKRNVAYLPDRSPCSGEPRAVLCTRRDGEWTQLLDDGRRCAVPGGQVRSLRATEGQALAAAKRHWRCK